MGFWKISRRARVEAMRAGHLTLGQCMSWAERAPQEVPIVNNEWEFIAAFAE